MIWNEVFFIFLLLRVYSTSAEESWIVHIPTAFMNTSHNHQSASLPFTPVGKRLQKGENGTFIEKCDFIRGLNPKSKRFIAVDFEALYAIENFFWGMERGLSIELGSLDGSNSNFAAPSQTADFKDFNWNRIIIEANPIYRKKMKLHSDDAYSVNAAICNDSMKAVHYIHNSGAKSPVSGILEFMTPNFLQTFYSFLLTGPSKSLNIHNSTLPSGTTITEIFCLPLQNVLNKVNATHINFFVLDVEGGELDILYSIQWDTISFDVLCIETDKANRPEGFSNNIRLFLDIKGYKNVHEDRRNSWYQRKDFIPSKRPRCCPAPYTNNFPFS